MYSHVRSVHFSDIQSHKNRQILNNTSLNCSFSATVQRTLLHDMNVWCTYVSPCWSRGCGHWRRRAEEFEPGCEWACRVPPGLWWRDVCIGTDSGLKHTCLAAPPERIVSSVWNVAKVFFFMSPALAPLSSPPAGGSLSWSCSRCCPVKGEFFSLPLLPV